MQRYHDCPNNDTHVTFDGREISIRCRQVTWKNDTDAWIAATHPNVAFDHIRPDQIPGF